MGEGEEEAGELVGGGCAMYDYGDGTMVKGNVSGDLEEVVVVGCMEASSFRLINSSCSLATWS